MTLPNVLVTGVDPATIIPSTFIVETGLSSGSAFLIEPDLAITAAHVVEGHSYVGLAPVISVIESSQTVPSFVVYVNKELDLAVLRLLSPHTGEPLELATVAPAIASEVSAFGAPGGVYRVTDGEVVSVQGDSVQASTLVAPGNSGGPLVNSEGQVVGVIQQYDPQSEYALAITSPTVAKFIESVPESAWNSVPTTTTNEPLIVAWFVAGFLLATLFLSVLALFIVRYRRKQARARNLITITLEGE